MGPRCRRGTDLARAARAFGVSGPKTVCYYSVVVCHNKHGSTRDDRSARLSGMRSMVGSAENGGLHVARTLRHGLRFES